MKRIRFSVTFTVIHHEMEKRVVTNEVIIKGSLSQVWDMLTNPKKTKLYMFGCETVTDWKPGNELLWRGNYQGQEMVFVKGYVIDIIPEKLLKYSVIDPNATYAHIPENHLNVTYELSEAEDMVKLTVSQDGFETAADGDKRYEDVYNKGEGWNPILLEIKRLTETAN
jgi:uncharacterized protein YndB with AHSA1/START domain